MAGRGKVNMRGAGIGHVTLAELPGQIPSIAAVGRFAIEESDRGRSHTFSARLRGPDGNEIVRSEQEIELPPEAPVLHEGERHGVLFLVTFPEPTFYAEGPHAVAFYIDDEPLADAGFIVEIGEETS